MEKELVGNEDREAKSPRFVYGQTIRKDATLAEGLKDAGMTGWNVRTEPAYTADGLEIPGHQVVLGEVAGATTPFAVMKSRYTPMDYGEAFGWGQTILDNSDLELDTIGYYRGGRRGFVSFRIPNSIKVAGADEVRAYLNIISSHDGTAPIFTQVSLERLMCSNQISGLLSDRSKARYSVRHIGVDPLGRQSITAAREALGVAFGEIEGFQQTVDQWANTEMTPAQVDRVFSEIFPVDLEKDSARVVSRMTNAREFAEDTYEHSDAQKGMTGNAWGLFSGITEAFQWKETAKSDEAVAASVLDGGLDRQQRRVAGVIGTVAGIPKAAPVLV